VTVDGWSVTFSTAKRELGGAAARLGPPRCTIWNSPPILMYNGPLTCGFNVLITLPATKEEVNAFARVRLSACLSVFI